jgi:hypothetical protein
MAVSLREVTADTVRSICALQTTEEQKRFVAPNALSIARRILSRRLCSEQSMLGKRQSVFLCGVLVARQTVPVARRAHTIFGDL